MIEAKQIRWAFQLRAVSRKLTCASGNACWSTAILAARRSGRDPEDEDSQIVYVNKVGTFGVSCASYWWTRISAAGIIATHHLLGPEFVLDLLLYADDLKSLWLGLWAQGHTPSFKWAKVRCGFCAEWLGMETEYNSYPLGLTKSSLCAWSSAIQGKPELHVMP